MPTYQVKMNNSKSTDNRYDPTATRDIRFFHFCSDSIRDAIEFAEQQFAGECESASLRKLSSPQLKFSNLRKLVDYELMSSPGSPNDTIIFRKNYQKFNVTLRGLDFPESGSTL